MTQSYRQLAGFPYKAEVIYHPPTEEDWEQINSGLESLASIVADLILEERRKAKSQAVSHYQPSLLYNNHNGGDHYVE